MDPSINDAILEIRDALKSIAASLHIEENHGCNVGSCIRGICDCVDDIAHNGINTYEQNTNKGNN